MRRSLAPSIALAVSVTLMTAGSAAAEPNTCIAGKLACTNAYTSAVFKCYAKVFKTGFGGQTQLEAEDCVRKARSKFGTALSSSIQCWDKVEAKEKVAKPETVCPANIFDEFDVDSMVEEFTIDTVSNEVASKGPKASGNTCHAGKVKCLGTFFSQLFKCEIKAHKAGVPADEACIAKATAKFDGGGNPVKGCFAKLEAKDKPGKLKTHCDETGNTMVAGGKVEEFVAFVVIGLEP